MLRTSPTVTFRACYPCGCTWSRRCSLLAPCIVAAAIYFERKKQAPGPPSISPSTAMAWAGVGAISKSEVLSIRHRTDIKIAASRLHLPIDYCRPSTALLVSARQTRDLFVSSGGIVFGSWARCSAKMSFGTAWRGKNEAKTRFCPAGADVKKQFGAPTAALRLSGHQLPNGLSLSFQSAYEECRTSPRRMSNYR